MKPSREPNYTEWPDEDIISLGHMSPGAYKELVRRYIEIQLAAQKVSDSDTDGAVLKVSDSDTTWAWTERRGAVRPLSDSDTVRCGQPKILTPSSGTVVGRV